MDQLRLAIPESLRHLKEAPALKEHPFELSTEFYKSHQEMTVDQSDSPLLMVLTESDYIPWFKQQSTERISEIGIIVVEEGSETSIDCNANHRILSWIDPEISPKRWEFVITEAVRSFDNLIAISQLEQDVEYRKLEVDQLHEIGIALSAEKSLESLLDLIITNSMELTHADAGSLYLIEEIPGVPENENDYFVNKRFRFEVAKNESRNVPFQSFVLDISKKSIYGYVALTNRPLLIEDAYYIEPEREYSWGGREFDITINYRTKSMLTIPMLGHEDTVIGVIQLINCKKKYHTSLGSPKEILDQVIPFTPQHAKAIQSIASQAAVALQNKKLIDSIQTLFDGFINASVKAIESRDPTTSGHSSRVAALTVGLAEALNRNQTGRFAGVFFTAEEMNEIRYASLLHDFGKIGVREQVLVKSKKLYPHEQQAVADRFKLIRMSLEFEITKKQLEYSLEKSHEESLAFIAESNQTLKARLDEIDDYIKFIIRCNEPTVLAQGGFERLQEISQLLVNDNSLISTPYLNVPEVASLSVPKGSLNDKDRREIESHVTHTYKFLSIIPWTKNLREVPKIAYAHHEKLNGKGYPQQLEGDQIPLQSKIMTIADIYDALTAYDRPYKKAIPPDRALNILEFEAKDNHIDNDLLELFIEAQLYQIVARPMH
ncbi:MAG: GAF domain-containing protein [SAR324 cluster bacterium]|nr:GAF domain-containing protein [SAR324 cluster bacterium]